MSPLLGIFGGTFNPPHIGHLILAAEARAQLSFDRVLWVLTPDPPHKQDQTITGLEHRQAMVQQAICDNPNFELSRVDIERSGPHFASDTARIIAEQNPGKDLVYLMGGDSLCELPTWHHPADFVAKCCYIGVMRRPEVTIDLHALEKVIPGVKEKVRYINAPILDISSHSIRQRVAEGRPFRYYLPAGVCEYIARHHLYQ